MRLAEAYFELYLEGFIAWVIKPSKLGERSNVFKTIYVLCEEFFNRIRNFELATNKISAFVKKIFVEKFAS